MDRQPAKRAVGRLAPGDGRKSNTQSKRPCTQLSRPTLASCICQPQLHNTRKSLSTNGTLSSPHGTLQSREKLILSFISQEILKMSVKVAVIVEILRECTATGIAEPFDDHSLDVVIGLVEHSSDVGDKVLGLDLTVGAEVSETRFDGGERHAVVGPHCVTGKGFSSYVVKPISNGRSRSAVMDRGFKSCRIFSMPIIRGRSGLSTVCRDASRQAQMQLAKS